MDVRDAQGTLAVLAAAAAALAAAAVLLVAAPTAFADDDVGDDEAPPTSSPGSPLGGAGHGGVDIFDELEPRDPEGTPGAPDTSGGRSYYSAPEPRDGAPSGPSLESVAGGPESTLASSGVVDVDRQLVRHLEMCSGDMFTCVDGRVESTSRYIEVDDRERLAPTSAATGASVCDFAPGATGCGGGAPAPSGQGTTTAAVPGAAAQVGTGNLLWTDAGWGSPASETSGTSQTGSIVRGADPDVDRMRGAALTAGLPARDADTVAAAPAPADTGDGGGSAGSGAAAGVPRDSAPPAGGGTGAGSSTGAGADSGDGRTGDAASGDAASGDAASGDGDARDEDGSADGDARDEDGATDDGDGAAAGGEEPAGWDFRFAGVREVSPFPTVSAFHVGVVVPEVGQAAGVERPAVLSAVHEGLGSVACSGPCDEQLVGVDVSGALGVDTPESFEEGRDRHWVAVDPDAPDDPDRDVALPAELPDGAGEVVLALFDATPDGEPLRATYDGHAAVEKFRILEARVCATPLNRDGDPAGEEECSDPFTYPEHATSTVDARVVPLRGDGEETLEFPAVRGTSG